MTLVGVGADRERVLTPHGLEARHGLSRARSAGSFTFASSGVVDLDDRDVEAGDRVAQAQARRPRARARATEAPLFR